MALAHHPQQLSPRQHQALQMIAQGHTDKTAARELSISPFTVKEHLLEAARRLGAVNRANLIHLAHQKKLLMLPLLFTACLGVVQSSQDNVMRPRSGGRTARISTRTRREDTC